MGMASSRNAKIFILVECGTNGPATQPCFHRYLIQKNQGKGEQGDPMSRAMSNYAPISPQLRTSYHIGRFRSAGPPIKSLKDRNACSSLQSLSMWTQLRSSSLILPTFYYLGDSPYHRFWPTAIQRRSQIFQTTFEASRPIPIGVYCCSCGSLCGGSTDSATVRRHCVCRRYNSATSQLVGTSRGRGG